MTDPIKPVTEEQRQKVIRQRNLATALVLGAFVVLFFVITIAKMQH